MIHPTNPDAVRVKRDNERGWHWVARFDPAIHEPYGAPIPSVDAKPTPPARRKK